MNWALYAVAALVVLSTLVTITQTGKPRPVLTPEMVAVITVIDAAIIVVLVLAAIRL